MAKYATIWKIQKKKSIIITHLPSVLTGPFPAASLLKMKYWGIEIPKKRETPKT